MKHSAWMMSLLLVGCAGGSTPAPVEAPPAPAEDAAATPAEAPSAPAEGTSAPPPPAPVAFEYTSLGPDACKGGEVTAGMAVSRCPGFGGYELQITGHDHGSELDFVRAGEPLGFTYPAPGWMADVTDGKIEWRHRGGEPHALIFRVKWTDASSGTNVPKSTLVVARLDGATACEIGRSGSNDAARAMADDPSKVCG